MAPWRRVLPWLSVLLAACSPSLPPRGKVVMRDVAFPLRDMRFPSGLRVIVEEDHRAPLVGVVTVVGAGSTSDPRGKEGLAHYVEHLSFRSRPEGKSTIRRLLDRAGAGTWNAYTDLDDTIYVEVAPQQALSALLRIEGARLSAPITGLAPEAVAVEREVIRSEIRQRNETGYDGPILGWMQAAVFPAGHPYSRPLRGTHESLSALTLEDAQAFAREHYRPDNITMVITGDVNLQQIHQVIEASLPAALRAGTPGTKIPPRLDPVAAEPPDAPPAPMGRREAAVATPELWIGWSLPRGFDTESYLGRFLGEFAGPELSRAFPADDDVNNVTTTRLSGKRASMLLFRITLRRAEHPEETQERVHRELDRIWAPRRGADGARAEEQAIGRLIRAAVIRMVLGAEDLTARGITRAELTHFSQDPTTYARELRSVVQIEHEHVAAFARKYLTRARARAILVTPLRGGTAPVDGAGGVAAAPPDGDELVAPDFDDATLRALARPPGVAGYRSLVLDNGLEVVIGRRAGLPVVTLGLSLHGGEVTAAPAGAAVLADYVASPRTTSYGHPSDIGATWTDRLTRDEKLYTIEGAAGNVGNLIAMLSERTRSMWIEGQRVRSFRHSQLPFMKKLDERPEARASHAFWRALYGSHPYGQTILARDLEPLDEHDGMEWIEATHVPHNAALAVVGEIDPDEVEARVRERFEDWSSATAAQPPPPPPAPEQAGTAPIVLVTHRPGATQGQIKLGCLLPAAGDRSPARDDLAATVAEEHLTDILRQRLGATYGIHGHALALRGGARHLSLTGDVDNESLAQALGEIRRTLAAFGQGQIPEGEIARARWTLVRKFSVSYQTNASIVSALLRARNEGRDAVLVDGYAEDLGRVSMEDLKGAFGRCVAGPVVLSIVGDEPIVRAALKEGWP